MLFKDLPPILSTTEHDLSEKPRDFETIGNLLEISYRLWEHPIFGRWGSFTPMNAFSPDAIRSKSYKMFNPTVIERTIAQARQFSQYEVYESAKLTLTSKGTEMSIALLRTTWEQANDIFEMTPAEQIQNYGEIHFFRTTRFGEITAIIRDFLQSCWFLIRTTYENLMRVNLQKIDDRKARISYLLTAKKDLLHQQDQFVETEFKKILEFLDIELSHYHDLNNVDLSDALGNQIKQFLEQRTSKLSNAKLLGNLLNNQLDEFVEGLKEWVMRGLSFYDVGGNEPERVYHAFLTGSFHAFAEYYTVLSNRESGLGRFDLLLKPLDSNVRGLIFEVKRSSSRKESQITQMLAEAIDQVIRNKYAYELKDLGTLDFVALAIVFHGKEAFINYRICPIP